MAVTHARRRAAAAGGGDLESGADGGTSGQPRHESSGHKCPRYALRVVAGVLVGLVVGYFVGLGRAGIRTFEAFGMSNRWHGLQTHIWSASSEAYLSAEHYYQTQRPLVMASARKFRLHQYFSHTQVGGYQPNWFDLISARMTAMAHQFRQIPPREDFKIEKNKCDMYDFFKRNKMPFAPIIKRYDQLDRALADWDADAVFGPKQRFPVIMKTCHITQGIMKSTELLPSAEYVKAHKQEIRDWIESKWNLHPDDWTRPWYQEGNEITQKLVPGLFFQEAFPTYHSQAKDKTIVVEIRAEVFWGHAYLANTDSVDGVNTIVLRDGTIETYPGLPNVVRNVPTRVSVGCVGGPG